MDKIDEDFKNVFMSVGKMFGFNHLTGSLVALLYLNPKEIAMDSLAEETGYSLASVSNSLKTLESLGIVRRIKKPGTKKIFYYMEKDLLKLNIGKIVAARENLLKPLKMKLPEMIKKYKGIKDIRTKEKLKSVESYYQQILTFEMLLEKWAKDLEEF